MNNETQIYVFTGDGKGKTTAALGLAVRMAVECKTVYVVQFLKGGGYSGELFALEYLTPYLNIKQFGYGCPISKEIKNGNKVCSKCGECFRENRNPARGFAQAAFRYARDILNKSSLDMLVLDEVSHAIRHNLVSVNDIIELIKSRPPNVKMVLTGRQMPAEIIEVADEVTQCALVKHPMKNGIDARRGIEY